MEYYTGLTSDGVEVSCTIDPEIPQALVEYDGYSGTQGEKYIRFEFNPDFPEDAKKLFAALCEVKKIIVDE